MLHPRARIASQDCDVVVELLCEEDPLRLRFVHVQPKYSQRSRCRHCSKLDSDKLRWKKYAFRRPFLGTTKKASRS